MIAAAVVAAHNNALRSWLRADGRGDAVAAVDHALGQVRSAFGGTPPAPRGERPEDVVVVVARRDAPLWRVVRELESALGRS
ncbi:TetR family transcriptional regulator OS=Streptomyces fumanus OX=67302 GN=GCM10018772_26410 PE=4 SV=1 [Streptomyces fumanus]